MERDTTTYSVMFKHGIVGILFRKPQNYRDFVKTACDVACRNRDKLKIIYRDVV